MPKPAVPYLNWNHPLNRGLVLHVPFYEGGGTTVKNLVQPLNGTLTATPSWNIGALGSKLVFNGTSQYTDFGNILLSQTVVTVAMLFEVTATPSTNFEVSFGYGNTRWFFIWNGATTKLGFNVKISSVEKGSGYPGSGLSLNTPYLAIGSYDPNGGTGNLKITVYGAGGIVYSISSTQTGNMDSATNNIQIGHDPGRGFYNKMNIYSASVWNRILSQTEQIEIYTNPWQIYTRPTFLQSLNTVVADVIASGWRNLLGVGQ